MAAFSFNRVHLVSNAYVINWKKETVLVQPNPLGIFVRKFLWWKRKKGSTQNTVNEQALFWFAASAPWGAAEMTLGGGG